MSFIFSTRERELTSLLLAMVSCISDPSVILNAKRKLESDESDAEPGEYLCRVVVFCRMTGVAAHLTELLNVLSENSAGMVVQFASSVVLLIESSPCGIDHALQVLDDADFGIESSHVCSSEEGVERVFDEFRVIQDSTTSGAFESTLDKNDEDQVVSTLIRVKNELLTNVSPKTRNMDECLSQIVTQRRDLFFTSREFLQQFDIRTHVCRVVDDLAPEMECLMIESESA